MPVERNLRDLEMNMGKGKLYWETDVISGLAKKTPAETEQNETVQHTTKMPEHGALGGEAKQN